MKALEDILPEFHSIGLPDLNKAGLMDRMETKFWFREDLLFEVLENVRLEYQILEISAERIQHYQSEYFDTPEMKFYMAHHNGRLNRYKIRTRYYTNSQIGFFELKFKNNKNRTFKKRISHPYAYGPITDQAMNFLREQYPFDIASLEPVLKVEYDRITLVRNDQLERVTIDCNLQFVRDENTVRNLNGLVIAEVKQDAKSASPFFSQMKALHIRPGSLSKYCMGMALLNPEIKKNNFLYRINKLQKLCY